MIIFHTSSGSISGFGSISFAISQLLRSMMNVIALGIIIVIYTYIWRISMRALMPNNIHLSMYRHTVYRRTTYVYTEYYLFLEPPDRITHSLALHYLKLTHHTIYYNFLRMTYY